MSITITLMNLVHGITGVLLTGLTAIVFVLFIWWSDGVPKNMRWKPRQFIPVWSLGLLVVVLWPLWIMWSL